MNSSAESEHEAFQNKYRGGVFLKTLGVDLYPHPYLGFALPPRHRSAVLNTDDEGFRLSDSPFGTVDTTNWSSDGNGGLLLGSSVTFGLTATSDNVTLASHLAFATGRRWLNLGVLAANSLQELIAAVPYLHDAATVVIFSGLGNYLSMLRTRNPDAPFGPVFYDGTYAKLQRVPLFDLAALAMGENLDEVLAALPPLQVPPEPDLSDVKGRVQAAARMQLRDLAFVARTAEPRTRVLFCLQPLATPGTRKFTAEEEEHYPFDEPIHGIPMDVLEGHLGLYTDLLAEGCADLNVDFVPIAADRFVGRSFVSNGVLSDEGNRQAALMIREVL